MLSSDFCSSLGAEENAVHLRVSSGNLVSESHARQLTPLVSTSSKGRGIEDAHCMSS